MIGLLASEAGPVAENSTRPGVVGPSWFPLSGWWEPQDPWTKTAILVVGAIVVYVLIRKLVIGRLERIAAATDNDVDDRIVQFARSFLGIIIAFVAFLLILAAHKKPITPLLV